MIEQAQATTRGLNKKVVLRSRPHGLVSPENFAWEETAVPSVTKGQFLVRNRFWSLDPAMRGWINPSRTYIDPVSIGAVMRAAAAGEVVESQHPDFPVGARVAGWFGLQQYCVSDGVSDGTSVRRPPTDLPLSVALGPLGLTGLTAYFGLFDIGAPKPGETVVVSTAAGAVGSIVVQLAKMMNCRVIGLAGGPEKCRWVESIGADACIDYKSENLSEALRRLCPEGVDVYFDNVGGEILDAALRRLNKSARVVLCGAISQYNAGKPQGPAYYAALMIKRARMEGFVVFDFEERFDVAERALADMLRRDLLKYKEDVVDGLINAPEALLKLFSGANTGKLLVRDIDA